MIAVYILCILIGLIISGIISAKFEEIAEMKGHNGKPYFWYTFLFGVVGMLMVIALPNVEKIQHTNVRSVDTKPKDVVRTPAVHSWRCSHCGNMTTQSPCEHCGE